MRFGIRGRPGFTMVELLTVIAIIAILAGIIFPVFGTLKRNTSKAGCLSNLHAIAQSVKMYKDDYRVYPEALYGFSMPVGTTMVDRTFLYPQYIKDRTGFKCPLNIAERTTEIGPAKLVDGINGVTQQPMGLKYYLWDSYDGTRVPHTQPNAPYLVHYLRRWDTKRLGDNENPKQLIYRYPPDATVITWCTYHRSYQTSETGVSIEPGSIDIAVFLDGRAKPVPSNLMVSDNQAHDVSPGI